jgi:hypothetical protein
MYHAHTHRFFPLNFQHQHSAELWHLCFNMATLYPDVKFVDVPVTNDNANLHQGLKALVCLWSHLLIRRWTVEE